MITGVTSLLNRLKLKHKFTLAILVNILIILIAFFIIIDKYHAQNLSENLRKKNRSMVKKLSLESVDPLLLNNYQQLDSLVKSTQKSIMSKYAYIIDSRGRIVAHTDRSNLGNKVQLPEKKDFFIKNKKIRGLSIQDYFAPVRVGGELLGWAVLGIDKYKESQLVAANLKELRYNLFYLSAALFFVGMFSSYLLAWMMTKRISKLKENMHRVQLGDLDLEISNERSMDCAYYFKCLNPDCEARDMEQCWMSSLNDFQQQSKCMNCPVFKHAAGDEIGELNLVFNQMVKNLKLNINKLEQANLEKNRMERLSLLGQMASQVAHEIKNPLNAIKGSADYLKNNFSGKLLQEFLSIIQEESKRLSDIVQDFLNFSKPGPAEITLSDFNQMIRETLQLVDSEIKDKDIELETNLDPGIPPFYFDGSKLKQAVLNILVNAVQATDPGGMIRVYNWFENNNVHLCIQDTGEGIPADKQEDMFKPFYTGKVKGSGLGLAIVEQNVKEHQGSIDVQSTPGYGSSFTITIPGVKTDTSLVKGLNNE